MACFVITTARPFGAALPPDASKHQATSTTLDSFVALRTRATRASSSAAIKPQSSFVIVNSSMSPALPKGSWLLFVFQR